MDQSTYGKCWRDVLWGRVRMLSKDWGGDQVHGFQWILVTSVITQMKEIKVTGENRRQKNPRASGGNFARGICIMLLGRWIMEVLCFHLQLLRSQTGFVPLSALFHPTISKRKSAGVQWQLFWEETRLLEVPQPSYNFLQKTSQMCTGSLARAEQDTSSCDCMELWKCGTLKLSPWRRYPVHLQKACITWLT